MKNIELDKDQWAYVRSEISKHANEAYPQEACGFLFLTFNWVEVMRTPNVDDAPWYRFRIDEEVTRWAMDTGRLIGVWHSHPSDPAVPSEVDSERAVPRIYFLVYAVQDEDLGVFVKDGEHLLPVTMVMPS